MSDELYIIAAGSLGVTTHRSGVGFKSRGMTLYWCGFIDAVRIDRNQQRWAADRGKAKRLTAEDAAALVMILGDEDLQVLPVSGGPGTCATAG